MRPLQVDADNSSREGSKRPESTTTKGKVEDKEGTKNTFIHGDGTARAIFF